MESEFSLNHEAKGMRRYFCEVHFKYKKKLYEKGKDKYREKEEKKKVYESCSILSIIFYI